MAVQNTTYLNNMGIALFIMVVIIMFIIQIPQRLLGEEELQRAFPRLQEKKKSTKNSFSSLVFLFVYCKK